MTDARKNISLSGEAYDELCAAQRGDESFTTTVPRLCSQETPRECGCPDVDAVAAAVAERLDIPDTEDIATETSTRTVTELRTELR